MKKVNVSSLAFFLGGGDAEMARILEVLADTGVETCDKKLSWGAAASAYEQEIAQAVKDGKTPVLVELGVDIDLPEGSVIVDHHGDRSGEPVSILQVLSLLGIEPTRKDLVIAANDSGWFPGLVALGATAEEMRWVRGGDRAAQGITPEMEAEAVRALAAPVEYAGKTRVIRMSHSKCQPIGDTLAIEALASKKKFQSMSFFQTTGK
jgi:hypothetical protein